MKLLCCDDDVDILNLVQNFFSMSGHTVAIADSAFGLSKRVTEFRPDVLLLDHRMPGLSGENFLEVFRNSSLGRSTLVIFYSAEDREKMAAIMAKQNVLGWIPKNVMGRALVAEVERLTREHLHSN